MAENNVKKVVLVGIQNSGKTSIALSLKGVKNITRFSGHPTREIGIERFNALGTEFGIFDLGGQDSFRKSHLENFDARIKNADKIIYVIDVQDDKSYDSSLKYMEDIIKLLIKEHLDIKFSIFLHKYDPDIKIDGTLVENLIKKIKSNISKISSEFKVDFFKTSIYTVFQKTEIMGEH